MSAGSCEESVSAVLDTLYDGAVLLAGDSVRAEALIVDVTAGACAAYARSHEAASFDAWLPARAIRSDRSGVAHTLFAARRSLQLMLAVALRAREHADTGAA